MMSNESGNKNGIGFTGLLTIVFITLKLIGKIDWSWWWVLSPLWAGFTLAFIVFFVIAIIAEFKKGENDGN